MSEPTSEPGLADALVKAQQKLPAVNKDAVNPHFKSRFVSLDALIAATRPILNEHGLAISQFPVQSPEGLPVLRTTILHGPSGERISGDTPLFLSRNDMQAFGAAITYARRYAWSSALGIASEEDTDGAAPEPAAKQPQAARMASKAQKAKMAVAVKELDSAGAGTPFPDGYVAENWVEVLRERLRERYGVESRTDLTMDQASELIDWLEAQAIPF